VSVGSIPSIGLSLEAGAIDIHQNAHPEPLSRYSLPKSKCTFGSLSSAISMLPKDASNARCAEAGNIRDSGSGWAF